MKIEIVIDGCPVAEHDAAGGQSPIGELRVGALVFGLSCKASNTLASMIDDRLIMDQYEGPLRLKHLTDEMLLIQRNCGPKTTAEILAWRDELIKPEGAKP